MQSKTSHILCVNISFHGDTACTSHMTYQRVVMQFSLSKYSPQRQASPPKTLDSSIRKPENRYSVIYRFEHFSTPNTLDSSIWKPAKRNSVIYSGATYFNTQEFGLFTTETRKQRQSHSQGCNMIPYSTPWTHQNENQKKRKSVMNSCATCFHTDTFESSLWKPENRNSVTHRGNTCKSSIWKP